MSTRKRGQDDPGAKAGFYKSFQAIMLVAAIGFAGIIVYATIDSTARPIWSTSHYHFNVQYRSGNFTAMDEVVNNSLIPILQMYARHPTWRANIEFQGLMLEWMDRMGDTTRNTTVTAPNGTTLVDLNGMELLRYLVWRGQVQLIVIQYSDALALAYPYIDFFKSINYTRQMLLDLGLISPTNTSTVSRAVLLQEGQFMLGASRQTLDFRFGGKPVYDTFLTTRESLSYFGVKEVAPIYYYSTGGERIYVLPYNPVPSVEGGVLHHILWFQDGENVNAGEGETWTNLGYVNNTDEAEHFPFDEEKQANHERRIEDLEAMGNVFVTLDEWVDYLVGRGEARELDRWVPETHWAVMRYRSSFIWMGETKTSQVGQNPEVAFDDSEINARNYRAHQVLLATETLLNYSRFVAGSINASQYAALYATLTRAWLDLAEAQVTDSTGLTPRTYEGVAAYMRTSWAMANATTVQKIVVNATPGLYNQTFLLDRSFQVLPSNIGTNNPLVWNGSAINFTTVAPASITNLTGMGVGFEPKNNGSVAISTVRVETPWGISTGQTLDDKLAYSVTINFPRTNTTAYAGKETWSYAQFTGDFSQIRYTPSLWERENLTVCLNRSDYNVDKVDYFEDWDKELLDNFEIYLALSNGLMYSTNGRFAVIKNCTSTHVCAKWNTNDVRFMQTKTLSAMDPNGENWQFFVVPDVSAAQAVALANLINTNAPMSLAKGDLI